MRNYFNVHKMKANFPTTKTRSKIQKVKYTDTGDTNPFKTGMNLGAPEG